MKDPLMYDHLVGTKFEPIREYLQHLKTDSPVVSTSHKTMLAGAAACTEFQELLSDYWRELVHDHTLRPRLNAG